MKLRLLLVLLLHTALIQAQDIPFIKADQIDRWKQSDTDTVWVLNFWATWCGPCVAELPSFEKLNREYASQKVQVILVSNDFKKQVDSKVKPFVAKKKLKSRVVFMDESNPNNWIDRVSPEWSGAIPATLIISKRKDKYLFFEKQLTYEELEAAVKEALQR
ncbi:MAG: TlpA family protein disulfide reductase [Saprospiraceae bacterium]|nr:TlpA family protein disulfide reductase [Saprospiraceae bacterium]